jgi:hypothetical protein
MLSIIRSNAAGYVCGVNNAPPVLPLFCVARFVFLLDAHSYEAAGTLPQPQAMAFCLVYPQSTDLPLAY